MGATLTFISSTENSAKVEAYHNESSGSRAYWDYKKSTSSSWLNRGYTLMSSGTYQQYTFDSLESSTSYDFRVRIVDGSKSDLPVLASATTNGSTASPEPIGDTTPPTVTIDRFTNTKYSISLYASATDSESGVSGFYYYLDNVYQATVYGSTSNYTFNSLYSGTQYKVSVKAFDNDGNVSNDKYQYLTTASTVTTDISEAFGSSTLSFNPSRGGYDEWYRTSYQSYSSSYSYRSGWTTLDNQNSWFEIETYFSNDATFDFKYKVSSESGYDHLNVYVNDISVMSDSGIKDWQSFSYNLSSGTNRIRFEYDKDGSASSGDDCAYIDDLNITQLTAPDIPSHAPRIDTRLEGGFDLYWGSSAQADTYDLRYKLQNVTTWTDVYGISGTTYRLTGLDYGRGYHFEVRAVNSIGESGYTSTAFATTNPKTPSISEGGTTTSSISVMVDQTMSGNWDDVVVRRYSSSSTYIDSKTLTKSSYDANNRTLTWTGLSSGVEYRFNAISNSTTSDGSSLSSVGVSNGLTLQASTRPLDWQWTTKHTNGRKNQGATMPFATASEWKAFQDKINEFRVYKGETKFSFYSYHHGDNSFTTPTAGTFYAYYLRQVNNAISGMSPTGLSNLSTGDELTASYLNSLMDTLNGL